MHTLYTISLYLTKPFYTYLPTTITLNILAFLSSTPKTLVINIYTHNIYIPNPSDLDLVLLIPPRI